MTGSPPDNRPTVIPRIITSDVAGVTAFLGAVFGAQGEMRGGAPAEMKLGNSLIMVSDGGGIREAMPAFLYVYVENADKTFQRAIEAGAVAIEQPADMFYGDRRATVQDRWGNMWQIATSRDAADCVSRT